MQIGSAAELATDVERMRNLLTWLFEPIVMESLSPFELMVILSLKNFIVGWLNMYSGDIHETVLFWEACGCSATF